MIFDIEKINNLEKTISEHLMDADNHHHDQPHKPYWLYYRQDMPNVLMAIREFKNLLERLQETQEKDVKDNSST
tara:strand:- start:1188 stop:1409 length:222 start_codon:yes stop_codon:yes gene_type:complete